MSSIRSLVMMNEGLEVQVAVGARPDSPDDGVDITSWRVNGQFAPPFAALFLDGDQAQVIGAPAGGLAGPELWGYVLGQWWRIDYLNNGADVDIVGDLQGWVQKINIIGVFERLAIAGTVSAGACTAKLYPIDHWS